MHLAVAAGAKTLCIASAAFVGEIVPYAAEITPDNVSFIYTPMECQGCLGNCIHPTESGMFPCINRINRVEVINKVEKLLGNFNINPKTFLLEATSSKIKEDLRKKTEEASNKGIFGLPSFIVNNKIFWGQDRLEFVLNEAKK